MVGLPFCYRFPALIDRSSARARSHPRPRANRIDSVTLNVPALALCSSAISRARRLGDAHRRDDSSSCVVSRWWALSHGTMRRCRDCHGVSACRSTLRIRLDGWPDLPPTTRPHASLRLRDDSLGFARADPRHRRRSAAPTLVAISYARSSWGLNGFGWFCAIAGCGWAGCIGGSYSTTATATARSSARRCDSRPRRRSRDVDPSRVPEAPSYGRA